MKTNKLIPLMIISIIAISSVGAVNATNDFGKDDLGWLPIHFKDCQGGFWVTYIVAQVKINDSTYNIGWHSSARSDFKRTKQYDDDYKNFETGFAHVESEMKYNNKIKIRAFAVRVSRATTSFTPWVTFNKGDKLEFVTDTYSDKPYTDLEIWRNGYRIERVTS
ncbi:MAG: hypothetical protein LBB45_05940 [Methanobrevibacter sp.]|jgi:hypothetical protein|nr:hypothetical protein [Candidatus Methanovirga basalitermitum]